MSNFERTTSWQQIQQGVKEIERLLARNDYNLVMVRARQVLECMVRCMAERACLVEGDLADTIDQLFENRLISRATKDNYHTIRVLGNKAVHEGDNTPYDANKAYKLLTQEVYAFATEFQGRSPASDRMARSGGSQRPSQAVRTGSGTHPSAGARNSSGNRASGQRSAGSRSSSGSRQSGSGSRASGRSSYHGGSRQGSGRRKKRRRVSPLFYLLRFLIPILVIALLVVIIKLFIPGKEKKPDPTTTAPTVTTIATQPAPTLPPLPPTEPPTEPVAAVYRVKGSGVNIRTAPSTDSGSTVIKQLSNGTEVEYVKRYNDDWAVINYDGREVYISSQYLERVEPDTGLVATQPEESGVQE